MKNNQCWAKILDDCSSEITSEHIITKSFFENKVRIRGFDWCKELKTIGISSFTVNNLCKKHNNDLSDLDNNAQKFWHHLGGFNKSGTKVTGVVNGLHFERWCLKSMVNMMVAAKPSWLPENILVKIIFGQLNLPQNYGLGLIPTGITPTLEAHVGLGTLLNVDQLIGLVIKFRGLDFIVSYNYPTQNCRHPHFPNLTPMHRLEKFNHKLAKGYVKIKY